MRLKLLAVLLLCLVSVGWGFNIGVTVIKGPSYSTEVIDSLAIRDTTTNLIGGKAGMNRITGLGIYIGTGIAKWPSGGLYDNPCYVRTDTLKGTLYTGYNFSGLPFTITVANLTADTMINVRAYLKPYIISGTVTANSLPIEGATVTIGQSLDSIGDSRTNPSKTTTTGSDGSYSIVLYHGQNTNITVTKSGFTFTADSVQGITGNRTKNFVAASAPTYTITGDAGVEGATVAGTSLTSATADGSGDYSLTAPYGWTGTITPSKSGYTFSPTTITVSTAVTANLTGQNFTAAQLTYTISGSLGQTGVTVTYTGGTATVTGSNYTMTVAYGWSGTVKPTKSGYTFSPDSTIFTNVTSNQTQDFTGAVGIHPVRMAVKPMIFGMSPFNGAIIVSLDRQSIAHLSLYNVAGRRVAFQEFHGVGRIEYGPTVSTGVYMAILTRGSDKIIRYISLIR